VGSDHHKSGDVTHCISTIYSYGNVSYVVEHTAYCGDDINQTFHTLSAAENYLIKELIRQITDQLNFYKERAPEESLQPLEYYLKLEKTFNTIKDIIPSDEVAGVNWEEKYLELLQEVEKLKFERKYADKVLTSLGIDSKIGAEENFGMELSIGARILELGDSLKKAKEQANLLFI
jgi:hypothetical protein